MEAGKGGNAGQTIASWSVSYQEYIFVGGAAKDLKLSDLGTKLRVLKYAADQKGVRAQAYFDQGTPDSVLNLARKHLGAENVFTFTM